MINSKNQNSGYALVSVLLSSVVMAVGLSQLVGGIDASIGALGNSQLKTSFLNSSKRLRMILIGERCAGVFNGSGFGINVSDDPTELQLSGYELNGLEKATLAFKTQVDTSNPSPNLFLGIVKVSSQTKNISLEKSFPLQVKIDRDPATMIETIPGGSLGYRILDCTSLPEVSRINNVDPGSCAPPSGNCSPGEAVTGLDSFGRPICGSINSAKKMCRCCVGDGGGLEFQGGPYPYPPTGNIKLYTRKCHYTIHHYDAPLPVLIPGGSYGWYQSTSIGPVGTACEITPEPIYNPTRKLTGMFSEECF